VGQIFDRLERLVRSMTHDTIHRQDAYDEYISDADMREAWEELNRFLDEDEFTDTSGRRGAGYTRSAIRPPESLRKDYETLGIPFGSDYAVVKKAYREQLRIYHPDLHAGDLEKQKNATDITRRIIIAFRRIKEFHESGAA